MSKKRKPRSVWVWWDNTQFTDFIVERPMKVQMVNKKEPYGYVEFREVLPKKRKVRNGKAK